MSPIRWLTAGAVLAIASPSFADVKPHPLFTDHMVLQQGVECPVWGTAAPEEEVTVTLTGQPASKTKADAAGKWSVKTAKLVADNKPLELTIAGKNTIKLTDVLVGEVWICSGQSNMEWTVRSSFEADKAIKAANYPSIRLFTVPKKALPTPQATVEGKWATCTPETVPNFSAVGYFFGQELHAKTKLPIGLIHTSWGGTPAEAWTSTEALMVKPDLKYYVEKLEASKKSYDPAKAKADYDLALAKYKVDAAKAKADGKPVPRAPQLAGLPGATPNSPSSLYNGMIAPLVPFGIKGAIWYQGESNAGRAFEYRSLFTTMITDWRAQWKQGDFPFMLVQLAPFQKISPTPTESNWAELREAQYLATVKLPNVGMAVITDVGEENDIHPKKKREVGERLATAARAIAYGEKIEFSGPIYKSVKFDGNKAILTFDHVGGGLEAKGEALTGFTIAGADKKFVNAQATIQGDTVIVSAAEVQAPVAVRFGWANYPVVNFWNKAGLPASPFRTDDFPITTGPKK